jgi:hypothetical protein
MKTRTLVMTSSALIIVVVQFAAPVLAAAHPRLTELLLVVQFVCALAILWGTLLALGSFVQSQRWQPRLRTWWARWRRRLLLPRQHASGQEQAGVSEALRQQVADRVQQLGLALHGTTAQEERVRWLHAQLSGEVPEPLEVPPPLAPLYAEFQGLIRLLNHLGLPCSDQAQFSPRDLALVQHWLTDLERRLQQTRRTVAAEQQTARTALEAAFQMHHAIADTFPEACHHEDYQRLQGALKLLERLARDEDCPAVLVQRGVRGLQRDLQSLLTRFQQQAASA